MEIIYNKGYEQLRAELKEELGKSVNSFVKIGYLLKVARDTNILAESRYSNMEEFAYAEFKIDKGTASKFMAINDRFSEGGHSDHLKPEYVGLGWSKLSIMLKLPDSVNEEITDGFSKNEIQAIREEFAQAEKETPMETMLEGESDTTATVESTLEKAIRQLGESEPEIYKNIHAEVKEKGGAYDLNEIKAIMAPSGEMIYSIRIRGIGRVLLSVKESEETVSIINERTGEKEKKLWDDLARAWMQIIDAGKTAEENWEEVYGQAYPKKVEVAPVQPKKESKVKTVNAKPKQEAKTKKTEPMKEKIADYEEPAEKEKIPEAAVIEKDIDIEENETDPEVCETQAEEKETDFEVSETQSEEKEARWKLSGAELEDIWDQIVDAEESIHDFVEEHLTYEVVNREIDPARIKEAYKIAIDLAAGLEKLMLDRECMEAKEQI